MKSQIESILKNLIDSTRNGSLQWKENDPKAKARGYKRKMVAKGSDDTVFHTTIEYRLIGENWQLQDNGFFIENPDLPDGCYLISKYQNPMVCELRDCVISHFCKDLNPTIETIEDLLEGISKGISISTFRENKLNDLGIQDIA